MRSGKNNFFEEHIEKIVLAVVGIVCLWLLFSRVILSPNYIEYDDNKFRPGNIDNYISGQSKLLEDKLDSEPEPIPPYDQRADDFLALLDSAIDGIDTSVYIPIPNPVSKAIGAEPKYNLPAIGEVNNVAAGYIRAVAYVPTEQINEDNPYDSAENEPNDLDFVTVEGWFDIRGLYDRFEDSFAGEKVQQQWRDPCLAEPVFAAVRLQRQELLSNGKGDKMRSGAIADETWSRWQNVPRIKIDHNKRIFEVIEKVEGLPPGGIKVRVLQFDHAGVRMDLLQPQAYQIASAKEEWFPPSLHKKYADHQRETELNQKRKAREAEKQERERQLEQARSTRRRTTTPVKTEVTDEMSMMLEGLGGIGVSATSRSDRLRRHTERRERAPREKTTRALRDRRDSKTLRDFYDEFDEILLDKKADIVNSGKPLLFWAHDDTVQAGKRYRYRIRLGVFNPIAGTDCFSEADKSLKNDVILWSGFSDATEPVEIPRTLYFFPHQIQEAARTVTVRVCRYVLGYWYGKDFGVKLGEVIGKVADYSSEAEDDQADEDVLVPETIDYSTGAVLVDIVPVSDWSGGNNLRTRNYFDMLYSFDAAHIERMPIKARYWTDKLQAKFNEIKKLEDEPKEPLQSWTKSSRRRTTRRRGEAIGEITTEEEFIEMILKEAEESEKRRGRR